MISRRTMLTWTTPALAYIAVPAHAQTSIVCTSMPVVAAVAPSKCSGVPPVGEATLSIISDGADTANIDIEISQITVSNAAATDTITLPSLPVQITDSQAAEIMWQGTATDAVTCLPLSDINFEVIYRCVNSTIESSAMFNLTDILTAALP